MTQVLVLWADNHSANLGVRALAAGVAELARLAWGESTVVDFQDFGPGDSSIGFGGRSIVRDLFRGKNGPIVSKLRRYDYVLDSGAGDSFADIYGLKRLLTMHYTHRAAARVESQLVLAPQTIGPFNTAAGRVIGKKSLSLASTVFARDPRSGAFAEKLGCTPIASTDVVFALPQPAVATPRDIVFNVSGLLWNSDKHGPASAYRQNVLEAIRRLQQKRRTVSLLAHVVDNATPDNDVPALNDVAAAIGGELELIIPASLDEVRRVVSSANLVIGARMHACLNAISTGTPAIPWAYSRKFEPLMNDLGWTYTIDLKASEDVVGETLHLVDSGMDHTALHDVRAAARHRIDRTVTTLRGLPREGVAHG